MWPESRPWGTPKSMKNRPRGLCARPGCRREAPRPKGYPKRCLGHPPGKKISMKKRQSCGACTCFITCASISGETCLRSSSAARVGRPHLFVARSGWMPVRRDTPTRAATADPCQACSLEDRITSLLVGHPFGALAMLTFGPADLCQACSLEDRKSAFTCSTTS